MKQTIVVLVAGLVVLGGVFAYRQTQRKDVALSPSPSASASSQSAGYRLVVLTDTVTLKHGSSSQTVRGVVSVEKGDQVTTSASGRARLVWPNGTITTIEGDSQVVIKELSDQGFKSRIELIFGDIWSKVTKVLGAGQYYEVETQDTVAAVRGTVFRTSYRNNKARVQGIEKVVRVLARRADGKADESTATDVGEEMEVEREHGAPIARLVARRLTATQLKEVILERIQRERNWSEEDLLRIISSTPRPVTSKTPTPTPTPTVTPSQTPTPTITETPIPKVILDHTTPSIIRNGETFSLEGDNFLTSRSISQIKEVSIGGQAALYSVVGETSIFVTPGQLSAGTYDATVTTTSGDKITLPKAISIQ